MSATAIRALSIAIVMACKADEPADTGSAPVTQHDVGSGATEKLLPTIEGAKVLQSRSRGEGHAMAVWCIDQPDAIDRVKAALSRDGWSEVHTRGKGEQMGIAATKGDARFSARVGKRDPRCAGTFVSATVMLLGKLDLQLKDGEKIR
jgi:hypothetical protein